MTPDLSLHKTDFDAIYDQPDPRAYFSTLEPFEYTIPQHGADIFAPLLQALAEGVERKPRLLDVCCSYGIVATLLKTDPALADIYAHYGGATTECLTLDELVATDQRLLQERGRAEAPSVVGLDVAQRAVEYAATTGVLDAGFSEKLEVSDPSAELAAALSDVDLITTTGGIGYVTEKTFDRLLENTSSSTWVASFCLRTYDYAAITEALGDGGLVTEKLPRTFRQRRFTSVDEQEWAVAEAIARGNDPSGKEADGYYHADFYLSRPAEDITERPLSQMLPDQSEQKPGGA